MCLSSSHNPSHPLQITAASSAFVHAFPGMTESICNHQTVEFHSLTSRTVFVGQRGGCNPASVTVFSCKEWIATLHYYNASTAVLSAAHWIQSHCGLPENAFSLTAGWITKSCSKCFFRHSYHVAKQVVFLELNSDTQIKHYGVVL